MSMRPSPETQIAPAIVTDLYGLGRLLAERRRELGLSQIDLDTATGWPDGYTGKIEAGWRSFGQMSLPLALGALGVSLEVRLVVNSDARVMEPFLTRSTPRRTYRKAPK